MAIAAKSMLVFATFLLLAKGANPAAELPQVSESALQVSNTSLLSQAARAPASKMPPADAKNTNAACDPTKHVVAAQERHTLAILKGEMRVQHYLAKQNLQLVKDLCQEAPKTKKCYSHYNTCVWQIASVSNVQPGDRVLYSKFVKVVTGNRRNKDKPFLEIVDSQRASFEKFDTKCSSCEVSSLDGNGNVQVLNNDFSTRDTDEPMLSKMTPFKDWYFNPRLIMSACFTQQTNCKSNVAKMRPLKHELQTMADAIETAMAKNQDWDEGIELRWHKRLSKFNMKAASAEFMVDETRKDKKEFDRVTSGGRAPIKQDPHGCKG